MHVVSSMTMTAADPSSDPAFGDAVEARLDIELVAAAGSAPTTRRE